jgi:hypothetical protein
MGTGLWGLGYQLRDDERLVLLSNGSTIPGDDPDRLWPFILTRAHQRRQSAGQALAARKDLTPFLERQKVGKDEILCVREKDLLGLLNLLETSRPEPLPSSVTAPSDTPASPG